MSKTYRNFVKCGICTGSNTEYYNYHRRKTRNKNNHNLRNLMANYPIEDVDNLIMVEKMIHNDWDEPTDGTILIGKHSRKEYTENDTCYGSDETSIHWWNRKFGKYLKNKHYKH